MYKPKATVKPDSIVRNTLLRIELKISCQRSISNIFKLEAGSSKSEDKKNRLFF